jgi:hypothetical protein
MLLTAQLPLMLLACCLVVGAADAPASGPPPGQAGAKELRAYRVGSSSFGPALMEDAKRIIDATGRFVLTWDEKRDSASYTRLDWFATKPGSMEAWCAENIPRIEQGHYDFVIFQTINWLGITAEQQDMLLRKALPDVFARVQKAGAKVILYDKFVPLERDQQDPRARAWAGRYPEGILFNYLLHILVAKQAGISLITFGGASVHELWDQEPYASLRYFYNDTGHPGAMAHYISACLLARLMTGLDPVGSPVREISISDWQLVAFEKEPRNGNQAFYDRFKGQVKGSSFLLSDEQALALQTVAMKNHTAWQARLKDALSSPEAFAKVEAEIKRLRGEALKMEAYGFAKKRAEIMRKRFAEAQEGDSVNQATIDKLREKGRDGYFGKAAKKLLQDKDTYKAAVAEYLAYWEQNNSKLRDDVLLECALRLARCEAEGRRDEVVLLEEAHAVLLNITMLAGHPILLARLGEAEGKDYIKNQEWRGAPKRFAPAFAAQQAAAGVDRAQLQRLWKIYLGVWADPDLMDKLKSSNFDREVFLEADKEFAERSAKP